MLFRVVLVDSIFYRIGMQLPHWTPCNLPRPDHFPLSSQFTQLRQRHQPHARHCTVLSLSYYWPWSLRVHYEHQVTIYSNTQQRWPFGPATFPKQAASTGTTSTYFSTLFLTLNSFSFNGDYFQQTGGVAMGSRLGPNCACLFVGHVEEQIFQQYPGKKPDLYKRYIDYIAGAASCSKNELDNFGEFINNFHPSLKFTWAISDNQLPFLDLLLKPIPQGLTTSIHYKETDSHSYLTYKSSHPVRYKNSVPYSQFPRLKRICSDENDYKTKGKEMASFFLQRDYPLAVVDRALQHVHTIPRDTALRPPNDGQSNKEVIPLILTYNPINHHVKNILSRNFDLLKSDSETKELFDNSWVLGAYRRNTNLRDSWVSSNLQSGANTEDEPNGTFPCRRPRCKTCAHTNPASQINTPGGPLTIRQRFSSCIS